MHHRVTLELAPSAERVLVALSKALDRTQALAAAGKLDAHTVRLLEEAVRGLDAMLAVSPLRPWLVQENDEGGGDESA